jgi:hypothetical protein
MPSAASRIRIATLCAGTAAAAIPALGGAATLADTGTSSFDNWNFSSSYFALGFTSTGPAHVDGFSILVGSTTSAAITGSSVDIYGNHPTAPTGAGDLLGTLSYDSIAADSGRSRVAFTGSVAVPGAGSYWAKWRDLPAGQSVWIRMGNPGTPSPWTIAAGTWYLNGASKTGFTSTYFAKFRITGTAITAPTVSTLAPDRGTTAGGTTVTITGTGFTGATAVTFAGTPATSFTVDSATQITAVSPAGAAAGDVDVAVTTGGGTTALASGFRYEVPAPVATPDAGTPAVAAPVAVATRRPVATRMASSSRLRRYGRAITTTDRIQVNDAGRYSVFYESPTGARVPMSRRSSLGTRALRRTTYAAVLNLSAGDDIAIRARMTRRNRDALTLRIVRRDPSGALTGASFRAE